MGEVVNIGDYHKGYREKRLKEVQAALVTYKSKIKLLEAELSKPDQGEFAEVNRQELRDYQKYVDALNAELKELQNTLSGMQGK